MEPQKFAAELIHRLEAVQRTREAEEKLEERLKRVRMEEKGRDMIGFVLRKPLCLQDGAVMEAMPPHPDEAKMTPRALASR